MQEDPNMADIESEIDTCEQLKAEIKAAITKADADTKKQLQSKLKEAGLPIQYQKLDSAETLAKILSIVAQ